MRYTTTKATTNSSPMTSAFLRAASQPGSQKRFDLIATSAYYKAEQRGFMPGHELDDWLTAETEVNTSGDKS